MSFMHRLTGGSGASCGGGTGGFLSTAGSGSFPPASLSAGGLGSFGDSPLGGLGSFGGSPLGSSPPSHLGASGPGHSPSAPFRKSRAHSNRWSGAYNNFGDVPNSVLKAVLEHIDSTIFNSYATSAWHLVVTWAYLVVGMGLFPDSAFQFRSDQQRDVETLKAEYRRRSLLAGKAYLSDETPRAVMEKAVQLLQQRVDGMVQYDIMKYELQGVIRQCVSNGSSSRWLDLPTPPATEWVTHKDLATGRFYVTDNAKSCWLDELLPPVIPEKLFFVW